MRDAFFITLFLHQFFFHSTEVERRQKLLGVLTVQLHNTTVGLTVQNKTKECSQAEKGKGALTHIGAQQ